MRSAAWRLSVLGLLALGFGPMAAAQPAPEAVVAAARSDLSRFLGVIPDSDLARFGFENRSETGRAHIGDPLPVRAIEPDALFAYDGGEELDGLLSPTDMWLFPVVCDGRARTLLTVARLDDRWQGVDLGGARHATEIDHLARDRPRAAGWRLEVVRVFQASCTFLRAVRHDVSDLIPLAGTARALRLIGADEPHHYDALDTAEAIARLTPLVRATLEVEDMPR